MTYREIASNMFSKKGGEMVSHCGDVLSHDLSWRNEMCTARLYV